MSFFWEFEVEGRPVLPSTRRCYRGPMIEVERVMARSFTTYPSLNLLRARVLERIVDTGDPAVRTREVLLRVLHSNLGSVFSDYRKHQSEYEAFICEKRSSIDVAADLAPYTREFSARLELLRGAGVLDAYLEKIHEALLSKNAVYRVAGCCAFVLMSSILEMRT